MTDYQKGDKVLIKATVRRVSTGGERREIELDTAGTGWDRVRAWVRTSSIAGFQVPPEPEGLAMVMDRHYLRWVRALDTREDPKVWFLFEEDDEAEPGDGDYVSPAKTWEELWRTCGPLRLFREVTP